MFLRFSIAIAALVLAASAYARAETYTPTPLTPKQILAQAHAAYGRLAPGTYQEIDAVHSGAFDYTDTTVSNGTDYRTTIDGGGFESSYGYDGTHSWEQNPNGIVTVRSNFRNKSDPNVLALEHPDDPKYHVRVLGITTTVPHQYVLDVNPPGGFDQFRYYDVTTHVLTQTVSYTSDRYRHVTTYSDYHTAFGETMPYRVHSYDGRPQNDTTTTTLSYMKDSTDSLAMPTPLAFFNYTGKPIVLPATFTDGGIVLHTQLNGHPYDFILDSGASGLFIDPGAAHALGLTPYGRSSETIGGGDVDMGHVRIADFRVGPLDMKQVAFTTAPFDSVAGRSHVIGLIGYDFLASGIYKIDFKARTLTLYPSNGFDPKALGLNGVPLQLDDGIARANVWINGVHGHVLIDTGAFSTMLYSRFANKVHASSDNVDTRFETVGGGMNARVVHIQNLIFGGIRFQIGRAIVPDSSTFNVSDYDGLLGRDVLSAYQLFFDYPDHALFVKPNM